ncbi:MAG: hypothetical protein IT373_18905 [Polyangiaceae bacterium]|nr:hypothetical protein [Polyangiaceae bacterium]
MTTKLPTLGATLLCAACAAVTPGAPRDELALPPASPDAPSLPGPAPRRRTFDAAAVNARCESCHAEVAREWRASLHAGAHRDPVYVSQFAHEPLPFCTGCHAPEADPTLPVPEPLSVLGVGCVTCHVVGDRILAAPDAAADADGVPHALTRTADFAADSACAACHEFAFPGQSGRAQPLLMQSTVSEHAASPYAARSCASCHMPEVAGSGRGARRSHAFSASRDESFVRSAVVVEGARLEEGALTLTVRPGLVGHAFPTGDMLRRLALRLELRDARGAVLARQERFFQRRFGFRRAPNAPPERVLEADQRVGVGAGTLVAGGLATELPAGTRLHYALHYERVADPGSYAGGAVVDGSILLAEGELTPP